MFRYIDRGRNPQFYTKDCIEKALHKNEQVKGKIDALKKFKANLLTDLGTTFPNELVKYRALRSNCYNTSNVAPHLPQLNIVSSGSSLTGPAQQQNVPAGPSLSIQQQLNNTSSLVKSASCMNSMQQSSICNISPLLGCDSLSTGSANSIGGHTGTQ